MGNRRDTNTLPTRQCHSDQCHNGVGFSGSKYRRDPDRTDFFSRIERICRMAGYEPTIICTPDELMEPDDEDNKNNQ